MFGAKANTGKRTVKPAIDVEKGNPPTVVDDDSDKYAKVRRKEGGCLCGLIRSIFRFGLIFGLLAGVWIFYESGHIKVKIKPLDAEKFMDTAYQRYNKTVHLVSSSTGYDLSAQKYGVPYGDEKNQQSYSMDQDVNTEQDLNEMDNNPGMDKDPAEIEQEEQAVVVPETQSGEQQQQFQVQPDVQQQQQFQAQPDVQQQQQLNEMDDEVRMDFFLHR